MRGSQHIVHMHWYVRSLADGDTHQGELSLATRTVHAQCGIEFVPLKALTNRGPELPRYPPDPQQICSVCRDLAPRVPHCGR
ncbi:MAG: hypothetical protein ACRDSH_19490 [Pseudonocardiaceae bacterium]